MTQFIDYSIFTPKIYNEDILHPILTKIAADKSLLVRGKKACIRQILSHHKGILLIPYDITPIDLIAHLPIFCQQNNIQFIYVRKDILKMVGGNSSCCVFIKKKRVYIEAYKSIKEVIANQTK